MIRQRLAITRVVLGEEEEQAVLAVLRSGHLAQGPRVAEFEAAFARMCGVEHAVATSSGTTALEAAVAALDPQPGEEVITSPFTFAATVNAILHAGATVRFADIDAGTFTMDPASAAALVNPRTRALLPVHLYGHPAAMTPLGAIGRSHDLAVIEDAAQAHGACWEGRPVGGFGLACFSFYATKNITTGEGGMVTTDDDAIANRLRKVRNQGMARRYEYELPGHNWRLTDLQAAIGLTQLQRLEELTASRRRNAALLDEGLAGLPGLVTPWTDPSAQHVFHQYTVRVTREAPLDREGLIAALDAQGVDVGVYYGTLVSDHPCYRDHPRVRSDPTPIAAQAAAEVLSLPVHPGLEEHDVLRIVTAVREAFTHAGRRR